MLGTERMKSNSTYQTSARSAGESILTAGLRAPETAGFMSVVDVVMVVPPTSR